MARRGRAATKNLTAERSPRPQKTLEFLNNFSLRKLGSVSLHQQSRRLQEASHREASDLGRPPAGPQDSSPGRAAERRCPGSGPPRFRAPAGAKEEAACHPLCRPCRGSCPHLPYRGQRRCAARPRLLSGALSGRSFRCFVSAAAQIAQLIGRSLPEAVVYLSRIGLPSVVPKSEFLFSMNDAAVARALR
jgi:hypothetical protein